MDPLQIVVRYVTSLGISIEALRSSFSGIYRDSPIQPLKARAPTGEARRSGELPGVGRFQLHGFGCRVEFDDGEIVEFDWNREGSAMFDNRRLSWFAQSIGMESDLAALTGACKDLVRKGVLCEPESGWFSVATEPVAAILRLDRRSRQDPPPDSAPLTFPVHERCCAIHASRHSEP